MYISTLKKAPEFFLLDSDRDAIQKLSNIVSLTFWQNNMGTEKMKKNLGVKGKVKENITKCRIYVGITSKKGSAKKDFLYSEIFMCRSRYCESIVEMMTIESITIIVNTVWFWYRPNLKVMRTSCRPSKKDKQAKRSMNLINRTIDFILYTRLYSITL